MLMPYLHQDLVMGILLGLPVKSLLRFRCVCKSWCSVISDPKFDRMRKRRSNIFLVSIISCQCKLVNYEALENNSSHNAETKLDLPCDLRPGFFVWGSCDGLVCFSFGYADIFVWNPSTRAFKMLPKPTVPFGNSSGLGLGFDKSTGDYKVVRITHFQYASGNPPTMEVEVFALRSNAWRRKSQVFNFGTVGFRKAIPLNGAIHWLTSYKDSSIPYESFLVAFDLAEEKFQVLPKPDLVPNGPNCLEVLGECLCLCVRSSGICVWIMKEYGVKESWFKLLVLPHEIPNYQPSFMFEPLFVLPDGEIVGIFNGMVILRWNVQKQYIRRMTSCGSQGPYTSHVLMESLVSLA